MTRSNRRESQSRRGILVGGVQTNDIRADKNGVEDIGGLIFRGGGLVDAMMRGVPESMLMERVKSALRALQHRGGEACDAGFTSGLIGFLSDGSRCRSRSSH
jgi:hypothetical protein